MGPAHGRERLTALAADTNQTVSRCVHETGGEESSRCLMHSQSVVPCVGRASAREPHTRVPEEEGAMGGCTRIVPLGKGCAALDDRVQSPPSRKKKTDTSDHATATRTTHNVVSQESAPHAVHSTRARVTRHYNCACAQPLWSFASATASPTSSLGSLAHVSRQR